MMSNGTLNDLTGKLRQQAEKKMLESPGKCQDLFYKDTGQILHELRVHQIELEMQNEELRKANDKLEALQAHNFELFDLAPVGYCTLSRKGVIVEANLTFTTLLGMDRSRLVNQPISRFTLKEDQDICTLFRRQLTAPSARKTCELRMATNSGMVFWAQLTAAVPQAGDGMLHVVITDISSRKQAEEAIRVSEERYRAIADFTYDWEYWLNPDQQLLYCSPSCERITGYPADEFEKYPDLLKDIIHLDDRDMFTRHTDYIEHPGSDSHELEFRIVTQSADVRWIGHTCCAVHGPDGTYLGRRASNRDITDRKRLENELLKSNATLTERVVEEVQKNMEHERMLIQQSRMSAMGEMVGSIAHHWRQPLNALSILLYNIKDACQYNELDQAYMDKAFADGNRLIQNMSATITDFHGFFCRDKKKCTFSLRKQIGKTVALVESDFLNSHITLYVDAPHDLILSGSPHDFSQALFNLLSNAKEAILNQQPPGRVDVTFAEQDGCGCIWVRDTGGGIPPDIRDRIFDPYFSTKENRSGIGLYMSKMIIERHMNGCISAKNIEGGAEFAICVPLAEDDACTL